VESDFDGETAEGLGSRYGHAQSKGAETKPRLMKDFSNESLGSCSTGAGDLHCEDSDSESDDGDLVVRLKSLD